MNGAVPLSQRNFPLLWDLTLRHGVSEPEISMELSVFELSDPITP
jgi:hypothetical protein